MVTHNGNERLTPVSAIEHLKNLRLIVEVDGEKEALPLLRQVWDSVKDLDVGAITSVLKRKAKEEKRQTEQKVTVAGLTLPSTLLTLLGPILIIIMDPIIRTSC